MDKLSSPVVGALSCKATIRLICEYLEGRLAPSVAREVNQHLAACKNCRMVMDAARRTLEVDFDRQPEAEVEPAT